MAKSILFFLLFSALLLNAHPPKSIELGYDAEAAALSVKVLHKVSDPDRHFIRRISVYSGKELLAEKTYERQDTPAAQEEIFLFLDKPLARGTAVTVTAVCSVSGKKSADLEWD
jgi:desulfoferrodoxin (superoxide reductase-like protein)